MRGVDTPVRRYERLALDRFRKGQGRLNNYWGEVISQDLAQLQLTKDMTLDRRPDLLDCVACPSCDRVEDIVQSVSIDGFRSSREYSGPKRKWPLHPWPIMANGRVLVHLFLARAINVRLANPIQKVVDLNSVKSSGNGPNGSVKLRSVGQLPPVGSICIVIYHRFGKHVFTTGLRLVGQLPPIGQKQGRPRRGRAIVLIRKKGIEFLQGMLSSAVRGFSRARALHTGQSPTTQS
ncbi:hypothetical protein RND71_021469 [Anisodus tanguticus]|uniref:Uncharacterized protein n=1 Tax=Anisodus tanguticus TaxID=243964 RepID=A0AAE1RW75_9SOLA|nr:hypothetical protein RND71_021469 [Anisodus tanguticus]